MTDRSFNHRILIVDDSPLNQHMLRGILEQSYALEMAGTAKDALEKIDAFRPHLILLDIILPDANGFELLGQLKESDETRDIPVIVISGLDGEADEERGFLLGAVDYIKKPFKDAIVRARVDTQIRIVKQLQTIEQLGLTDALTGVANRRAFDNQIVYEWGRAIREGSVLSLLMLDIDHFKNYNDSYGHPQGDAMLRAVAGALRAELKRSVDILCRYGGEEFAVLLPGTGGEGTRVVAEKLRTAVAGLAIPLPDGKVTHATVSIGAATLQPKVGDDLTDLVALADKRLYAAKQGGRNRICDH